MKNWLYSILGDRRVLWILLIVNTIGTIYGFYWYKSQLEITPVRFMLFVPDSPTASLFFVLVLIGFLLGRHFKFMEALAIVSLFKYGIWAVIMNLLVFIIDGTFSWVALILIISHAAMALEGVLYSPYYRIRPIHLVIAAMVVLHNELIDYVFGMMPIYQNLNEYIPQIGYFTFWLSILSIAVGYWFTLRKGRTEFSLSAK